jgi:mono/diheme cytochrome c family protein
VDAARGRYTLYALRWVSRAAGRSALGALSLAVSGCSWFTDFKIQPKLDPWESTSDTVPPRGAPQNSVPITGTQLAGFQVSYAPLPGTIDSIGALVTNPTPVTDSSLANGRRYYSINCTVCHGDTGEGNGPATKYGMPAINLRTDVTRGRSDGYIYGMMRNGRGLMPNYNRIEEMDRWDVVNYLRALQAGTAATGPVGLPGEGGTTLPGYTRLGPTRPVPYYKPRRSGVDAGRNILGDPDPRNDVSAPAGQSPGSVSPLADTTERVEDRDTLSRRPAGGAPRTTAPTAPRTPAAPPAAAGTAPTAAPRSPV